MFFSTFYPIPVFPSLDTTPFSRVIHTELTRHSYHLAAGRIKTLLGQTALIFPRLNTNNVVLQLLKGDASLLYYPYSPKLHPRASPTSTGSVFPNPNHVYWSDCCRKRATLSTSIRHMKRETKHMLMNSPSTYPVYIVTHKRTARTFKVLRPSYLLATL